jgi:quercetin dioxygenase-like cupin family protein
MPYALKLFEDRLAPSAVATLARLGRVVYLSSGSAVCRATAGETRWETGHAVWVPGPTDVVAGPDGARWLRYELVRDGGRDIATPPAPGVASTLVLEHPIELDPSRTYLMRCDRVDFAPGGVALPHRHRGGGIRCLVAGALEVRVEGEPARHVRPGEAWFESGREAVYALAAPDLDTSFIRVAILPREIRGQTSILYVDPADASRGKPRRYTVYVDEPMELP